MNQMFGTILRGIYDLVGNYGLSIVVFTLITKIILLPLSIKQTKTTKLTQALQPKIEELKRKYPHDQEKQNEETMKLYQKYNFNPLGGCLPILIQFPIIIALFGVMREPTRYVFTAEEFATVDQTFLWIENLTAPAIDVIKAEGFGMASIMACVLPLINFGATLIQQKMTPGQENQQAGGMGAFMKFMPFLIGYTAFTFSQGLSLYWACSTIMGMLQTVLLNKIVNVEIKVEETPKRESLVSHKAKTDDRRGGRR
ncbi:MAG: YidC/Oxa1 family membrane protein insertase [Eubacteriaceae bacterium]|nr:YidC/Oxa1 family membrane protein insertase [Eubacteriaceae bacterium]